MCVKEYAPIDLLCIGSGFFTYMESINRKGYITDNILQQNFMIHIMDHLFSLGYERKV